MEGDTDVEGTALWSCREDVLQPGGAGVGGAPVSRKEKRKTSVGYRKMCAKWMMSLQHFDILMSALRELHH